MYFFAFSSCADSPKFSGRETQKLTCITEYESFRLIFCLMKTDASQKHLYF